MARFKMKQKLVSIGDDFWIEDEQGNHAYRVDGKAMRIRDTFVLEDSSGREVAKIQERKLSIRDKVAIERDGRTIATVHKALIGFRDRFAIDLEDGKDLKARGNIIDHGPADRSDPFLALLLFDHLAAVAIGRPKH